MNDKVRARRTRLTMSGLLSALVVAMAQMLREKPCLQKMPCQRRNADLEFDIIQLWSHIPVECRENIFRQLLVVLYVQRQGYDWAWFHRETTNDFSEMGEMLLDEFDGWVQLNKFRWDWDNDEKVVSVIKRLLRLRRSATREQLDECFCSIEEEAEVAIGEDLFRLLTRGCNSIGITEKPVAGGGLRKCLLVQYLPKGEYAII